MPSFCAPAGGFCCISSTVTAAFAASANGIALFDFGVRIELTCPSGGDGFQILAFEKKRRLRRHSRPPLASTGPLHC